MSEALIGVLTFLGRVLLCAIFLLSAVANDIPHFNEVTRMMATKGIPAPQEVLLGGAIAFKIAGSVSVIIGYKARLGAFLLLIFLALATYYFHNFWDLAGPPAQQEQIQFMKNLSMMGAMLFIIANGPGPMSFDARAQRVH